jgi:rare lipoprotein A
VGAHRSSPGPEFVSEFETKQDQRCAAGLMVRKYSVAVSGSAFEARSWRLRVTRVSVMSVSGLEPHTNAGSRKWRGAMSLGVAAWALAGCATPQPTTRLSYSHGHEHFAQGKKYGRASRKVVADGESVPHGGGQYLVGHPYTIAGHRYYPAENPSYTATGMASWYGAAFHGRRTANGEVYDMASLSAAHPTMPLPSYARVTNLENGYSVIVRVNDRGPYHGGRVMDVSSRVADVLDMKAMGTAKVKVDYVGAAPIEGSDDSQLLASLRTDGSPANMIGYSAPVMMANAAAEQTDTIFSFFSGGRGGQQPQPEAQPAPAPAPEPPPVQVASAPEPAPPPEPVRVAAAPDDPSAAPAEASDADPTPPEPIHSAHLAKGLVPLPPPRPFDLSMNRRASTVAVAFAPSSSPAHVSSMHAAIPPRRPELHASAERALSYPGAVRLPPKKPTGGAFDRPKPIRSARADD